MTTSKHSIAINSFESAWKNLRNIKSKPKALIVSFEVPSKFVFIAWINRELGNFSWNSNITNKFKKNPIVTTPKYWFHCKHFDRVRTKVPKQQPEDLLHIFWWVYGWTRQIAAFDWLFWKNLSVLGYGQNYSSSSCYCLQTVCFVYHVPVDSRRKKFWADLLMDCT